VLSVVGPLRRSLPDIPLICPWRDHNVSGAPVTVRDQDTESAASAAYVAEARRHRVRLANVVVVSVTGSCGKTTTKDLTAAVLGSRFKGTKNEDTKNCGLDLAVTVLAAHPGDDFLIQELGAWGPGTLDAGIEFLRPRIAIVTNLRHDHFSSLHGPRGAQAEKGKLVAGLPKTGTAVLNWDDPLVRELSSWTTAQTLSFGRSPDAAVHGWDVSSRWPSPLSFSVTHGGETARVCTQLFGEHLLGSALAALSVGILFGMTLAESAAALESAKPTFRRMSPVAHPDGVTFIRDDWKAPADSIPEVLSFMRSAIAPRKLGVLGRISDFPGRSRHMYNHVAREALEALDSVVFVGERATQLWGERKNPSSAAQMTLRRSLMSATNDFPETLPDVDDDRLGNMFVFEAVQDADAFLHDHLRAGDLVLVKGSGPADHLERIILNRELRVSCWLRRCGRLNPCDGCDLVRVPNSAGGTAT
jgi:UDP-N-acetylmuramoyl-tripeptide--D-alanyl-D-alanine ligase